MDSSTRAPRSYARLLLDNGDFRKLYAAALISLGGDWFLTVALLDLVLQYSGSATLASLIIVLQNLPVFLATPFAGPLIDKVDRKKLMIVVDVIRCGAALLPLLTRSPETLVFAYIGSILISVGAAYFDPASSASLPNVVESADLGRANVLFGSTWGTMLAVGAALGGAVTLQFGRDTAFVVDSISFLFSALLLASIRKSFSEDREPSHEHPPLKEALRETWHYARSHRRVLALLVSKGGYGIGAGVVAMLSVFGREVFKAGALGIGLLFAARGVGALLGPFIVRGISRTDDQQYRSISYSVFVFGAGYMALALSPNLWLGLLGVALAHLGGGAQWQTSSYGLQRETPDWIRGRVFSVDFGFVELTISVSSLLTGIMADRFGPIHATIATATLCVAWAVAWGVSTRKLWRT